MDGSPNSCSEQSEQGETVLSLFSTNHGDIIFNCEPAPCTNSGSDFVNEWVHYFSLSWSKFNRSFLISMYFCPCFADYYKILTIWRVLTTLSGQDQLITLICLATSKSSNLILPLIIGNVAQTSVTISLRMKTKMIQNEQCRDTFWANIIIVRCKLLNN